MFLISWKIETELPQKSVNMRRISSAPVNDRVVGLHGHDRVVGEVGEDRVDVLRVDRLEVAVRQGRELVAGQRLGLGGHDASSTRMSDFQARVYALDAPGARQAVTGLILSLQGTSAQPWLKWSSEMTG